jgi:hypothetical protein
MRTRTSRSIILVALLSLGGANSSFGRERACRKTPLIEVDYDASGMLSPQGKYLYFSLCNDGFVQYEVEKSSPGTKEVRRERLTDSQFSSLRELLESEEIKNLRGTYDSKSNFRDYRLSMIVHISRSQEIQTFTVLNILSNDEESFPLVIPRLLCAVDKLRNTDFKMSHNCPLE